MRSLPPPQKKRGADPGARNTKSRLKALIGLAFNRHRSLQGRVAAPPLRGLAGTPSGRPCKGLLFFFLLLEHASGEADKLFDPCLPDLLFVGILLLEGFSQFDHQIFKLDGL